MARRTVADVWGADTADALARWAIDVMTDPPADIRTATTRISTREVERGRRILEGAGVDWRALKAGDRSGQTERRERRG